MPSINSAGSSEQTPEMMCPHLKKLSEEKQAAQNNITTSQAQPALTQPLGMLLIDYFSQTKDMISLTKLTFVV